MDGFGGQTWNYADNLSSAQADMFFSPTAGIGLEYVRTANTYNGSIPDLVTLQEAVARGAKVELGLQSPPANLKYSLNFDTGAAGPDGGCIDTNNFGAWAAYIVSYIQNLQANGIPIDVVSVQNEPEIASGSLGACQLTASMYDTFIGTYLGPALHAAGLTPKVMLAEMGSWFGDDEISQTLNDPTAAQYVSIAASHGYGSGSQDGMGTGYCCATASAYPLGASTGKHLWQSEVNGGFHWDSATNHWYWDPSMADALVWARSIHDYMTIANASGWEYWELAYNSTYNAGLTDANFNPAKRFYAVGNWSKFVRSGWVRVDATANPVAGVYVTAFKDPGTGDFAVVAVNSNATDVAQTFATNGFLTTTVTPWVTSASLSLAQQPGIAVTTSSFAGVLPADSVTTFVGTAQTSNAPSSNVSISAAVVYPDPVMPGQDPTIRVCPGTVDSVDITVFDASGRIAHSATVAGGTAFVPRAGVGAGQYCYEHVWTGSKASGVYFAVVHAKSGGTTLQTRLKFAVVR